VRSASVAVGTAAGERRVEPHGRRKFGVAGAFSLSVLGGATAAGVRESPAFTPPTNSPWTPRIVAQELSSDPFGSRPYAARFRNAVNSAIVGFLGVIAGGLVTGGVQGVNAFLGRRLAGRAAARLVYQQLVWGTNLFERRRASGVFPLAVDWDSFGRTWAQNRALLAQALSTRDFMMVSAAFESIEQIRLVRVRGPDFDFHKIEHHIDRYESNVTRGKTVVLAASCTWRERRRGEPILVERDRA